MGCGDQFKTFSQTFEDKGLAAEKLQPIAEEGPKEKLQRLKFQTFRGDDFGPFRVDTRERVLLRDGQPVALTPKAFETLLVLVRNSGHLVEKDQLMKAVWPETFVEEANLTQNIFALRRILGEKLDGPKYIETIPRRGYRFVARVREFIDATSAPPASTASFDRHLASQ